MVCLALEYNTDAYHGYSASEFESALLKKLIGKLLRREESFL